MRIILCVDDNGGLLFNNRRQSRDKRVVEKVLELVQEKKLWITEFSQVLFEEGTACIDSEMLEQATEEEFCFVENLQLAPYIDKISEIYLFKWNRKYPWDVQVDFSISDNYKCVSTEDFEGNSHEKITLEVWKK